MLRGVYGVMGPFKGISVLFGDTNHCYFLGHNVHKVVISMEEMPQNCNEFNGNCVNIHNFCLSYFH